MNLCEICKLDGVCDDQEQYGKPQTDCLNFEPHEDTTRLKIKELEAENAELKKRMELVFKCFKPVDEAEAKKLSLPQTMALELIQEIIHGGSK